MKVNHALLIFNVANMSFIAIRENEILAQIVEFYSILSVAHSSLGKLEVDKDQESIQSSTTPGPGHHI